MRIKGFQKDKTMKNLITIFAVLCLAVCAANAQVVCNKFKLVTNVTGFTLDLSVNTDLPDNTVVMVSVSRSYLEKGNSDRYSVNYFSEKSTIGKWKSKHRISIASETWKSALRTKQKKLSMIGLGFDVASISDKITVSMVVPINQPDPKFGNQNSKLTGKAVRTTGLRVVEDEIGINYPLDSPPVGRSPFPSLNPLELENGQAYIVSEQTPLMPTHSPTGTFEKVMGAIQQMKQIPKGGIFEVIETIKKGNRPWYKVIAFNQNKQRIGTGWINSVALVGQELKAYNEDIYVESQKQATTEALGRKQKKDITYEIINTYTFHDYKRSLDVRLNKKVSEKTLRAIALKSKAQDSRNYERTFICYYLPDMEVGAGAWATTHFNPNLEVKILGFTVEQENALRQLPDDPSREVIGFWLDESLYGMGSRITIFRQNGKLFIENTYKDGSSGKKEIVEKLSDKGRTFRKKEGSSVGEFYLIDNQGNLQMWDEEGIISTAKKISSYETVSPEFVFLRKWNPNDIRNGFGADVLLQQDLTEQQLVEFIKKLAGKHDPVIIRVWTSRTAWQDKDAKTPEFKSDYILFYVKNSTGTGAYRGFNEIRWMQEIGKFSYNFGKKTKF